MQLKKLPSAGSVYKMSYMCKYSDGSEHEHGVVLSLTVTVSEGLEVSGMYKREWFVCCLSLVAACICLYCRIC